MKKRIVALLIAATMACAPAAVYAAEDTDARIAALEERVSALEELVALLTGPGVSAAPQEEAGEAAPIGDGGVGMAVDGFTLTYTGFELTEDRDGNGVVLLNFDFANNSGEPAAAQWKYSITVFQHGREVDYASISSSTSQAYKDCGTEIRSGSDPIAVAFAKKIQDTSDIIVRISSMTDWNAEPVEFTVSLE